MATDSAIYLDNRRSSEVLNRSTPVEFLLQVEGTILDGELAPANVTAMNGRQVEGTIGRVELLALETPDNGVAAIDMNLYFTPSSGRTADVEVVTGRRRVVETVFGDSELTGAPERLRLC